MSESVFLTEERFNLFHLSSLLLPLIIFLIFKIFKFPFPFRKYSAPLPPGPAPWPLIGNAHQMGKNPHRNLANLAKSYGPLIYLKLGTQHLIVGSSPAAATEILKTHDRILSGRYKPQAVPCKTSSETEIGSISVGWAPECNDQWKYLRTIVRTELFSSKAMESQTSIREQKAVDMVEMIREMEGKVVNIGEVVFATVFNSLSNVIMSRDFVRLNDNGSLKGLLREMIEGIAAPNISDLYPSLARFDLQGRRKKYTRLVAEIFAVWGSVIREKRESKGSGDSTKQDFLDVLIQNDFSDDKINQLLLELFSAGTDTTTSTIEWLMAELVSNPESMARVRKEIATEIKLDMVKESQILQLPYLQACIKESLRLHPPAPLLLPHRAVETCQVMNYTIPKNSQVMVNVWAIGRDPVYWEDPEAFKPERFVDSELDFKGNDFRFLSFGAGRRICPGMPLATKQVPIVIAALIHFFDWCLPSGNGSEKLDMNEKLGITLQKEQPLLLTPKARIC